MRRDVFDKAFANALPPEPGIEGNGTGARREGTRRGASRESMTTILAVEFEDGIMCAADRQVTSGYHLSWPVDTEKICQVAVHTYLLGSGYSSSITMGEDFLRQMNRSFTESTQFLLSLRGQARAFSRWWLNTEAIYGMEILFRGILAGFDQEEGFSLFDLQDGSYEKQKRFAVGGSGTEQALGVLDQQYREGMSFKRTLRVVNEAIMQAGNRDVFSSQVWVAIPSIAIVTKRETRRLNDEEIIPSIADILRDRPGVHHALAEALLEPKLRELRVSAETPPVPPEGGHHDE